MNTQFNANYPMTPESWASFQTNMSASMPTTQQGYAGSGSSMVGTQCARGTSQALASSRRAPLYHQCEAGPSAPHPSSTTTMPAPMSDYDLYQAVIKSERGRVIASGEQSYARLLFDCLMEAPDYRRPLADIYEWVLERSVKAQSSKTKGWQNSIRHNLSMNKAFIKVQPKDGHCTSNKGLDWALRPEAVQLGFPQPTTRFRLDRDKKKKGKAAAKARASRPAPPMSRLAAAHLGAPVPRVKREQPSPPQPVVQQQMPALPPQPVVQQQMPPTLPQPVQQQQQPPPPQQQPFPQVFGQLGFTAPGIDDNVQFSMDNTNLEQAAWMEELGSSSTAPFQPMQHSYAEPNFNVPVPYSSGIAMNDQGFIGYAHDYTNDRGTGDSSGAQSAGLQRYDGTFQGPPSVDPGEYHMYDLLNNPWTGTQ